jgi:hypothetical protein
MLGILRLRTLSAWLLWALPAGLGACGGPADARGQGGACFRANECAPGLVCIERVCTSDVSSVAFAVEAGSEAALPVNPLDGGAAGSADATRDTSPGPAASEAAADDGAPDAAGDEPPGD